MTRRASRSASMLACALAVPIASCASIVTGSTDRVQLDSVPQGAHYVTNAGHEGTTPAQISISDDVTLTVTCTADGYERTTVTMPPRMSGWVLGNLAFGGLIGLGLDFVSGNWRTHDDKLVVSLPKLAPSPAAP